MRNQIVTEQHLRYGCGSYRRNLLYNVLRAFEDPCAFLGLLVFSTFRPCAGARAVETGVPLAFPERVRFAEANSGQRQVRARLRKRVSNVLRVKLPGYRLSLHHGVERRVRYGNETPEVLLVLQTRKRELLHVARRPRERLQHPEQGDW